MQGKTHELVGLGFGIVATTTVGMSLLKIEPTVINQASVVAGALVGALAVDIDHTQSTLGRKAIFLSWPIYALNRIFDFISKHTKKTKKFWKSIANMFGHRGLCHSGLLWLLFGVLAYMMTESLWRAIAIGVVVGGFSHLVADSCNPSNIPWLLPFTKKRFGIPFMNISTGSPQEKIFRNVVLVLDIALLGLRIIGRL